MKHEGCRSIETRVVDSRWRDGAVWRRRVCRRCKGRITTFEISEGDYEVLIKAKEAMSELDEPQWAVVSHDHVKAADLTYAEASELLRKLAGTHDSGLCVVTSAVAARLRTAVNSE